MKKTYNVAIGGRSFVIDVDAYNSLSAYLDSFKAGLQEPGRVEVMEEVEMRIADLFEERLRGREVVNIDIVKDVITRMGMPDFQPETFTHREEPEVSSVRRFYRDTDNSMIGGICSGLALFLGVKDVTLVRVLFALGVIFATVSFWIYIVLWLIVPPARTAVKKCELRGIPANAENIRKYSTKK